MKPFLATVFARKGDSKIAFNSLDAFKVHESGNLFNCRAWESISPVTKRAQANLTIFLSLIVLKVFGVTFPVNARDCLSYADFIDSGNDTIEEAVMLFLTVLNGLNSSQEKAWKWVIYRSIRVEGEARELAEWHGSCCGTIDGIYRRPFRKKEEPRSLCSKWFSPGPNGAFSSRGIIQAPKGNVMRWRNWLIICIPVRENPRILKWT